MAKIAKSVDLMMKYRTLQSVSYNAFKTALSAGTIVATVIEPFSPLLRRLFTGIQLLSLAHQIALHLYRYDAGSNNKEKLSKLAFHVFCNTITMLALLSQSPWIIAYFFFVQGIVTLEHAGVELEKTNYLAGSVNLIMGSVRLAQGFQLINQLIEQFFEEKFSMKTMPSQQSPPTEVQSEQILDAGEPIKQQSAKVQSEQILDAREPIKQQLTKHEETVKVFNGEEYLYFKTNGPEKKFLILGALNPFGITPLIAELSKRFDVKFRTISSVEDIKQEIQSATQFGRVTGLMIYAHGSFLSMDLSDNHNNGWLTFKTISPDLFSGLDPHCVITLLSCSTAAYPYISLAYRVANASRRVTVASDNICSGIELKQLDPLEFSFTTPILYRKKPAKTIKIQPLEDDYDSFFTFFETFI
jgi:hypothetical protein